MITVRQLLSIKGSDVWSVEPDSELRDALNVMADKDVGALVVMDGNQLVGILSERDFARRMNENNACSLETPVREIMTEEVITIHPNQTLDECMRLMTDRRIRHLPVVVDGWVIGIITIGDVVKQIINEQASTITGLENYIVGREFRL